MAVEFDADTKDWLALALVPGLGPRLTSALLTRFGSPAAIRRASAGELRTVPHIGGKLSESFAAALAAADVEAECRLLEQHNVELLRLGEADYPARLAQINDPPHLLFMRGDVRPEDQKAIAIVGSRGMTTYGQRTAERLAAGLARAGFTIVSGLARGIDGTAHRAAINAGGRTIAVLAGGLARIYPPEHTQLADEVAENGALLTETPMQLDPQAGMFPARNRLISGLSLGVIIVEANDRSGALITARHALDQNREVFAVPGMADAAASAGCLQLIRQGAKLVRNVDDVLEDVGGIGVANKTTNKSAVPIAAVPPPELQGEHKRIWDALGDEPCFVDHLVQQLEMPVPQVTKTLMELELRSLVRRLPGGRYERR
jgi:DNA processing protein